MPDRMITAVAVDLKPSIDRRRRLTRRWSCSMRLLSGMYRRDAPIRIPLHGWMNYRPPTGIGVSGARMAGRPKYLMSCELELLSGRPFDLPGCAASADP